MNPRQTEEQASLYVLDLLSGEELEQFEEALSRSPDLRQQVRQLRSALFDPRRQSPLPAERLDLLDGIHRKLDLDHTGHSEAPGGTPASTWHLPWAAIWAAAALLFLGFNVILLSMMSGQNGEVARERHASANGSTGNPATEVPAGTEALAAGALEARIERLQRVLRERESELEQRRAALAGLEEENQEIRQFNADWQREYARLAARYFPFFEPNDGLSRFTVIEMVDAQSHEQQLPRPGFGDLAARFLTGEASIAGVGDVANLGPVVEGAGIGSGVADPSNPGITPVLSGDAASFNNAFRSGQTDSLSDAAGVGGGAPVGFTVWRDDEQKGFLDVYNLPQAGSGEAAYLWVRSSELETYIPIGALPELENGTGSLFYSVDEPNFTPTEILITAEPEGGAQAEPTGPVLLRGP